MAAPKTSSRPSYRHLPRYFNGRLLYSVSLIALSQFNFGMDQGAFSSTQAMPFFISQFGVKGADGKYALQTYYLSLLNSLNYIGFAIGLVMGNYIGAVWGRRRSFFVMTIWALIGALINVTSQNRWQILVGRIVAYIYIGMELAMVPVMQSELVPAPVRGLIVGTYQLGLGIGQLVMALICRGTSTIKSDASWQIPLGLLFIVPALIAGGIWYVPESPRWLLSKGRGDEALESLRKIREGRYSEEEIMYEYKEIQSTLDRAVDKGRFIEIFQGVNLKRTLIVTGVNIFLQLTGQNFSSVYGTVFIASIGTIDPFSMTSINRALSVVANLFAQLTTDSFGRVSLMLVSGVIQTGSLFAMGALGVPKEPSLSAKKGIVATTALFSIGFQIGWAPLSHVIAAEIPTQRLRDMTYAFGAVWNIVIQFAVSFSIPYLIDDQYAGLNSKVGFIFGVTAFFAVIFTWFCIPECSGKSLEEIDELFLEGVPISKFRNAHTIKHIEHFEHEQETEKSSEPVEQVRPGVKGADMEA